MTEKIIEAYQSLYYRFYIASQMVSRKNNPFIYRAAWFALSFLDYMNFLTLLMVLEIFTGYGFAQISHHNSNFILIGIPFFLLNYYLFLRKQKYKNILKKFENEENKSRVKGMIFAWLFVAFTFFLDFFFAHVVKLIRPEDRWGSQAFGASIQINSNS